MSTRLQLPSFKHPEVGALYEYDLSIPKEKIATILALPRATLIGDLKTILADFIERESYFDTNSDEEGAWLEIHTHVLWLLQELKAEETVSDVLNLLSQDSSFGHRWFGDSVTEDYWQILYFIGGQSLEELKAFVLAPGEWAHRIVASTAAEQIALHQPERRAEILDWYRSILEEFLIMQPEDPRMNIDVICSLIVDLVNLNAVELLPLIDKCYDKGLYESFIIGNYASVKQDIAAPPSPHAKRPLFSSIYDRYHDALTTWHGYLLKYDESYQKKHNIPDNKNKNVEQVIADMMSPPLIGSPNSGGTFQRTEKKVGRNEPCPCGSGKKYKRCCIKK